MQKQDLKYDILKINKTPILTADEVTQWFGRTKQYVEANILCGLETEIIEGNMTYYADDVVNVVYENIYNNRKFRGKADKMTKKDLMDDIKETFGSSFVTAGDVSKWLGRSRKFASEYVLTQIPSYGNTTHKLYFVGDVVNRLLEMKMCW